MSLKFAELNLDPRLLSAVNKLGYENCTPIQEIVIPLITAGKDISGLAQTGTGKTAAFLLPLMNRILNKTFVDWRSPNFILILVPTRELAEQVYENIVQLGAESGLRGVAVYGGTSYEKQKEGFRDNVEFVVATPGRLIDLYKDHFVDLKQVRAVVFDEADRMFDMGFKDDMKYILQRVPQDRQFLVFSATLNFDVLNTAYQFGAEPIEVNVSKDQARAENVKDEIFHVGHNDKPAYLLSLLKKYNPRQAVIFSNYKRNVEKIAYFLSQNDIPAMGISSLLTQVQRNRALELFKAENEKNILVATDVAARGLDIKGVDMVINFELPSDAESYVHRIGRTGRAGAEGRAFSLVCDRDVESLGRVEEYLKHKLESGWLEDTEIIKEYRAFPREDLDPGRSFEPRAARPERKPHDRSGRPPQRREFRRDGQRPDHRSDSRPAGPSASASGGHGGGHRHAGPARSPDQRHVHKKTSSPAAHGAHSNGTAAQKDGHKNQVSGAHPHKRTPHQRDFKPAQHSKPGAHRPAASKASHAKSAANSKSTVQKVTGFIKRMFGQSKPPSKPAAKHSPAKSTNKSFTK